MFQKYNRRHFCSTTKSQIFGSDISCINLIEYFWLAILIIYIYIYIYINDLVISPLI